ncbi:glycosyltransferase family 2 protein, partial [Candidatus Pacearchaeota archaeon]|nr:glycosyltransferase family 2 protein [Candidatus Pacearchaeota archaeon]
MNPELSLVIPIYNEESNIEDSVVKLTKELEMKKVNYELILVSHGSADGSDEIVKKISEKNKRIVPIILKKNLGYGGGVTYGWEKARGKYIGFTCIDQEISAEDTFNVFKSITDGKYDLVKARRMKRKDGFSRVLTSLIFNTAVAVRFHLGIKDVNGYPLIFRREIYKKIKPKEKFYLFNLDLIKNIKSNKYKILEV